MRTTEHLTLLAETLTEDDAVLASRGFPVDQDLVHIAGLDSLAVALGLGIEGHEYLVAGTG